MVQQQKKQASLKRHVFCFSPVLGAIAGKVSARNPECALEALAFFLPFFFGGVRPSTRGGRGLLDVRRLAVQGPAGGWRPGPRPGAQCPLAFEKWASRQKGRTRGGKKGGGGGGSGAFCGVSCLFVFVVCCLSFFMCFIVITVVVFIFYCCVVVFFV